jgi:prepilin-type N-terminal cleavage/methylation domain-containing protein
VTRGARGRGAGPRDGFVLAELLVALVIAAVIGVALTQLVISQSRFVALQSSIMQARGGARAALNVLSTDLGMVTDSGLLAATPESVTVRVPYAFGVACGQLFGRTYVSLLPSDSAVYASASPSGYAWRDSTGKFEFVQPATVATTWGVACFLVNPPIIGLSVPGSWPITAVQVSPSVARTPPGAVVYLYQIVRYAFAPSVQIPGRIALWRTVLSTGARSEMVAPFDSTAGFRFLVGTGLAVQATAPADLTTVYGLRLMLVSASEQAPEGRTAPMQFNLTTDVLFQNHP